jgi:hypothetical protein
LAPEIYGSFCHDAAEVIVHNILVSISDATSAFFNFDLRESLDTVERLEKANNIESVAAISLLVHSSKSKSTDEVFLFIAVARALDHRRYKLAASDEKPSDEVLCAAKQILLAPPLSTCLLSGLTLSEEDIQKISIHFVFLVNERIRGWCGPSMVILNVFALCNRTVHLAHHIPLAVLLGHEMRHALERMADGDFNFSKPTKTSCALEVGSRESGLGFELNAIGEKYAFPVHDKLVDERILAIQEGIKAGRRPALLPEQIIRFRGSCDKRSTEMAFDCLVPMDGFSG